MKKTIFGLLAMIIVVYLLLALVGEKAGERVVKSRLEQTEQVLRELDRQ